MRTLNIVIDSPAEFVISKTELDIGLVTNPYRDIAHCVRAALCISHDLRRWVNLVICFDKIGPMSLHLDPKSIRYMGTDERSILLLLVKGQNQMGKRKQHTPIGLRISSSTSEETVSKLTEKDTLFLSPGTTANWQNPVTSFEEIVMYCPLSEGLLPRWATSSNGHYYKDYHRRDLAILEILHQLDMISWEKGK